MRFRYSTEEHGRPVKKAVVYTQNEHRINFSDVDNQAVYIIERLQANGYETYIVGGAVRDLILGKRPKDFDIVTAANPARIKKIFRNSRIIGRRFRLVHVFFGPKIFEVSTFRSTRDGPTSNTFGTIEEDVLRRDFSLNALFYDPLKQLVVDYVGGMKDIHRRVIRPIIALPDIFVDDPVRMIRAVKYAAVTGFTLPLFLKWRIRRQSELLAAISASRLTEEIFKIINSPQARGIVESLDALGLYCFLQPRAAELFRERPAFRAAYLDTLGKLEREDSGHVQGETLSALIRDYLEEAADWDGTRGGECEEDPGSTAIRPDAEAGPAQRSLPERYRGAFILARKFVLPMNPPRAELDAALRLLFAAHGMHIKKARPVDRHNRIQRQTAAAKPAGSDSGAENSAAGTEPSKSPRRRRRKPASAAHPLE